MIFIIVYLSFQRIFVGHYPQTCLPMTERKHTGDIHWKDEYNVNVSIIDEHHKKFVQILNNLNRMIREEPCKDNVSDIFFALANYAEHYLLQEEIYFKNYKYPNFQQHKAAHQNFIDRIIRFREDYEKHEPDVCVEMSEFLQDWFRQHILEYDRDAVEFLVNQGLNK